MLDKSAPNNPVVLFRVDGHAVWLNSKALSIVEAADESNAGSRISKGAALCAMPAANRQAYLSTTLSVWQ